jgi:hypothetical protein
MNYIHILFPTRKKLPLQLTFSQLQSIKVEIKELSSFSWPIAFFIIANQELCTIAGRANIFSFQPLATNF